MKKEFSTEALIKNLKTNAFILNSSMPMGYVPNLPILCILNGNLCMKIPFLKYKVTGEIDKTFSLIQFLNRLCDLSIKL